MLTLLLRRDMTRAQALAAGIEVQGEQLRETLALRRSDSLQSLASPPGLLLCFAAGCALSLVASSLSPKEGDGKGGTALGLLLKLAREQMR